MNTSPRTATLTTLALALAFGLASCGDQGDGNGNMDSRTGNNATLNKADGGTSANGTSGTDRTGSTNADGSTVNGGSGGTGTLAPGAERMNAMTDLGGLRSTLMAELEMVRTRLNDGTRPEASAKADKERAAELAQGLERLDRALAAVNASNDTTWTAIRTSTRQEVDDLRAWMDRQGLRAKQG